MPAQQGVGRKEQPTGGESLDEGVGRDEVTGDWRRAKRLPMLLWAGRGVAMVDAHSTVLDAVSERTHTHEEDGFAAVIKVVLSASSPT
jgi:uracil DNA glycosylase